MVLSLALYVLTEKHVRSLSTSALFCVICHGISELLPAVLKELYNLFEVVRDSANFDISSDAFLSVKEMLTRHKSVSAKFILDNFDAFFLKYHTSLLQVDEVTGKTKVIEGGKAA